MANDAAIELIYDAIVDDAALDDLPAMLCALSGADSGWIMSDTGITGGPIVVSAHHGFDPDVVAIYASVAHEHDPWMVAAPHLVHGVPVAMSRHVTDDEFLASGIHASVRGRMDVLTCLATLLPVEGHVAAIAFQRGSAARRFDEGDEEALAPYVPHLSRMLRARHLRARNAIVGRTVFDAQLLGEDSVVICRGDATIVHANVPAEDMMAERSAPVSRDRNRLVSGCGAVDVRRSVTDAIRRGIPTVHNVLAPGRRHVVRVDPAPDGSQMAVVTIRDLTAHADNRVRSAAHRWGFTAAEARLALALVGGETPDQYATRVGLRMPTVRTQLRSLLAKVEVERQPQLVAEILASPTAR